MAALVIVNQLEAQSIIPGHGIFAGGLHKGSAGYIALMIIIVPLCVLIGYVILRCPACNAVLMDKITAEKCPECDVAFE